MIVDVVIPAYNEADHFRELRDRLVEPLRSAATDWDFRVYLVVNDDSDDESPELADELAETIPEVSVVHRTTNPGFGNALKDGFRAGDGDVVVPFMADYSDDPLDIPKLVAEIRDGADFVYGSRFAPGGSIEGYPPLKRFYNRSFNNLIRLLFGVKERDVTNAFSAYRRTVIDEIDVDDLSAESFDITAELPLRAHILGFQSAAVPVSWRSRENGVSKLDATQKGPLYVKRLFEMFVVGNVVALQDLFEGVTSQSRARMAAGSVLGVFVLLVVVSLSGLDSVFGVLSGVNPAWMGVAAIAYLGSFVIRTWRWRVLLRTSGHLASRGGAFRALLSGWFINFIIPARAGDVVRALALKTTEDVPFSVGGGTIVIERIFDMVVLALTMLVITVFFVGEGYTVYLTAGAVGIAAVLTVGLAFVYVFGDHVAGWLDEWIPEADESIAAVRTSLQRSVDNPVGMSLAFLLSWPVWVLEVSTFFFTTQALGISLTPIPVVAAGIAAFVTQAVPVTPAGIGTFQAAIVSVLSLFGIGSTLATSIGLLDQFTRLVVVYIIGGISTIHVGFRSRSYFREKRNRTVSDDDSVETAFD